MRPSQRLAVASLAGALALAGCTGEPEPSPSTSGGRTTASPAPSSSPSSSTPAPSTTTSSASSTASASASPSGTAPAGFSLDGRTSARFPGLGGDLGSTGRVRVGHHSGFDRVVWEFEGSGPPSYQVHYVRRALADGSGDPVPVAGDAFVEVLVSTVRTPTPGTARPRDARAAALAGTVIAQADAIGGGFEGYGQAFVGVRGEQRPLRVTTLRNPTRLVVDVLSG
jgi:hypothetical protein